MEMEAKSPWIQSCQGFWVEYVIRRQRRHDPSCILLGLNSKKEMEMGGQISMATNLAELLYGVCNYGGRLGMTHHLEDVAKYGGLTEKTGKEHQFTHQKKGNTAIKVKASMASSTRASFLPS
jgi:hypothetical protein